MSVSATPVGFHAFLFASHAITSFDTKDGTKVTITTPPFFGTRARIESGTLRGKSTRARDDECEKMTGDSVTSRASLITPGDTCDRSTIMPIRFISRTTSRPNAVSPPWAGLSSAASAQSSVTLWVSVM